MTLLTRLVATLALVVAFAACGDDDAESSSPTTTAATSTAETTEATQTAPETTTTSTTSTTSTTTTSTTTSPAPTSTTTTTTAAPPAAETAPPAVVEVQIADFEFSPPTIDVVVGQTIRWTHVGDIAHTVTSNSGGFDSGSMGNGDTFEFTVTQPGTINYVCLFHSSMQGVINVS